MRLRRTEFLVTRIVYIAALGLLLTCGVTNAETQRDISQLDMQRSFNLSWPE
jgi:hypothetical protein